MDDDQQNKPAKNNEPDQQNEAGRPEETNTDNTPLESQAESAQPATPSESQQPPAEPIAPIANEPYPATDQAPVVAGGSGGSRKKLITVVVAVVVAVLLAAGAAFAYFMLNNPQRALAQAVRQLSQQDAIAGTFTFRGEADGTLKTYNGDFSFKRDSDTPKNYEAEFGLVQNDARIGFVLRDVKETYYFKLEGLNNLGAFVNDPAAKRRLEAPFVKIFLNGFNNSWFKLEHEKVEDLINQRSEVNVNDTPSQEDIDKATRVYEEHPFLNIEVQDGGEIKGVSTTLLVAHFDDKKYVEYLKALQKADIKSFEVTDKQIQEAKQEQGDGKASVLKFWLTNSDDRLKRIKVNEEGNKDEYVQITFKPVQAGEVNVTAPENAQSLQELFSSFLGAQSGSGAFGPSGAPGGSFNRSYDLQPGGARLQ